MDTLAPRRRRHEEVLREGRQIRRLFGTLPTLRAFFSAVSFFMTILFLDHRASALEVLQIRLEADEEAEPTRFQDLRNAKTQSKKAPRAPWSATGICKKILFGLFQEQNLLPFLDSAIQSSGFERSQSLGDTHWNRPIWVYKNKYR